VPGGVEIPAHAAAGGPDRGCHPPLDAGAPALLCAPPRVEGGGPGPVRRREVVQLLVLRAPARGGGAGKQRLNATHIDVSSKPIEASSGTHRCIKPSRWRS
jgi:hypothetical protein